MMHSRVSSMADASGADCTSFCFGCSSSFMVGASLFVALVNVVGVMCRDIRNKSMKTWTRVSTMK